MGRAWARAWARAMVGDSHVKSIGGETLVPVRAGVGASRPGSDARGGWVTSCGPWWQGKHRRMGGGWAVATPACNCRQKAMLADHLATPELFTPRPSSACAMLH